MSQAWSEYVPDAELGAALRHVFEGRAAFDLARHFGISGALGLRPKRPIDPTHLVSYSARISISEDTA